MYARSNLYNFNLFTDIPDPKKEPLELLNSILSVLHEMGPWCADRAAVHMYHRIEKQKIKTPHERHYLLLCVVNTALLEVHAICEQTFKMYGTHKEIVERFSSSKVLKLFQILRMFKPSESNTNNNKISKLTKEIDSLDFDVLSGNLESSYKTIINEVSAQKESKQIVDQLDSLVRNNYDAIKTSLPETEILNQQQFKECRNNLNIKNKPQKLNSSGRPKRRPGRRILRDNADDNLCGLIYCDNNVTSRILFDLLSEMSRHDEQLSYLKCQFTGDRVADPVNEPKEAEAEHRRQEDVLKRFRMHDCNLLIGTSILEVFN